MAPNSSENPLGLVSIDHLEFTCDSMMGETPKLFHNMGFHKSFENKDLEAAVFSQGSVHFSMIASKDTSNPARHYFDKHGEGVSKISFLVKDAEFALKEAISRGATEVLPLKKEETEHGVFKTASIQGFGDVLNEFIERPSKKIFKPGYQKIENDSESRPLSCPITRIDHLTNNVPHGEMKKWVEFYERIYGFKVTRYFDIKGVKTGLESKVVQMPNGAIIIPINEPDTKDGQSQIQEFLDLHKGPGVQHIALTTTNIIETVEELHKRKFQFLDIPKTYYEDIPKRDFKVTEDLGELEKNKILVDGDPEGYLLQLFSQTYIGPLFFEYIQRKNHHGFGEGNFQALFDAIERDQKERGYLK